MRDHARALVGTRRTPVRVWRRRHDHNAALRHCLQLCLEKHSLLARPPRVRHRLSDFAAITLDRIEADVDARGQHEAVVGDLRAADERDGLARGIDIDRHVGDDIDVLRLQLLIGVRERLQRTEAAEV